MEILNWICTTSEAAEAGEGGRPVIRRCNEKFSLPPSDTSHDTFARFMKIFFLFLATQRKAERQNSFPFHLVATRSAKWIKERASARGSKVHLHQSPLMCLAASGRSLAFHHKFNYIESCYLATFLLSPFTRHNRIVSARERDDKGNCKDADGAGVATFK